MLRETDNISPMTNLLEKEAVYWQLANLGKLLASTHPLP
jgi:hypothetical protein